MLFSLKRVTTIVMALLITVLAGVACASGYPSHLNGDPNFILVDGHMGTGWYLDKSSIVVQEYNPPRYVIAANVCAVNDADRGNVDISNVRTMVFTYTIENNHHEMYVNGRYLDPLGSWAATGISMPAGEMAFYLTYDMKFYGSVCWSNDTLTDVDVFPDEFYYKAN